MRTNSKNNAIEAMRFLMMLVIVLWHSAFRFVQTGYLPVDFFFILSGYFIYRSYQKHNDNVCTFTIRKIHRFYPEYVIALLLALVIHKKYFLQSSDIEVLFGKLLNIIPELFFLQDIGPYPGGLNGMSWYLSVLLVGGAILYAMLRNCGNWWKVILPIVCLGVYTYCYQHGQLEQWGRVNGFYLPLWRGFAGMGLGIILANQYNHIMQIINRIFLNVASIFSLILFFAILFTKHLDNYTLICSVFIILGCLDERCLLYKAFKHRIWGVGGSISFTMLVFQSPFILVFNKCILSYFGDANILATIALLVPFVAFCYIIHVLVMPWLMGKKEFISRYTNKF